MSETQTTQQAKESGFGAAVSRTPVAALVEALKRFGLAVVLLGVLAWRMDQQNTETREMNKTLTEAALQNTAKFATIVEQNTAQSKQTQGAIEKFTESTHTQQRVIERMLDRIDRSSSATQFRGPTAPRAPVIE